MTRVRLELEIARPPEDVFDAWADLRQDMRWHPQAVRVEQTSPGPLGRGSTFAAEYKGMGPMELEVTEYERPRAVARHGRAKSFDFASRVLLAPTDPGTRLAFEGEVAFRGPFRLLAPLMGPMMRKQANATLTAFKRALEEGRLAPVAGGARVAAGGAQPS
jgi:carbon monoxide dehydrogenase subunit G